MLELVLKWMLMPHLMVVLEMVLVIQLMLLQLMLLLQLWVLLQLLVLQLLLLFDRGRLALALALDAVRIIASPTRGCLALLDALSVSPQFVGPEDPELRVVQPTRCSLALSGPGKALCDSPLHTFRSSPWNVSLRHTLVCVRPHTSQLPGGPRRRRERMFVSWPTSSADCGG